MHSCITVKQNMTAFDLEEFRAYLAYHDTQSLQPLPHFSNKIDL